MHAGLADIDVCSRFFAPWAGIPEDPVTGSAHAVLGAYYASKLQKTVLKAVQCSRRTGKVDMEVIQGQGIVNVSGSAVTVFSGTLFLPA